MKKHRVKFKLHGRNASFDVECRIRCSNAQKWDVWCEYDACVSENNAWTPKPHVKESLDTYQGAVEYVSTLEGKSTTADCAMFSYLRKYGLDAPHDLESIRMGYTEAQIDKIFKAMQKSGEPLVWSICEKPDKAPKMSGKGAYAKMQYENDLALYDCAMRKAVSCDCGGCVVTFYLPA